MKHWTEKSTRKSPDLRACTNSSRKVDLDAPLTGVPFLLKDSIEFALSLPTGDYDSSKSANIGNNRYEFKTTYQHSIAFNDSATWLDFYGPVKIFGDNDEYMGSNELSQDALISHHR